PRSAERKSCCNSSCILPHSSAWPTRELWRYTNSGGVATRRSPRAEPSLTLSMGNNTRCGVLDHILGLRKDQPAREPKGKTLPGGRCGAPGLEQSPLWAPTYLLHSRRGGADVNSQLRHRAALQ